MIPVTIEWDEAVLDDIRRQSMDGFLAFGHGGLEIGGILYGRSSDLVVEVRGAVPLPCDHALGPGFRLSGKEEEQLAALLQTPSECVGDFVAVGWYRSFTRSQIRLTEPDQRIWNHFPEPWQITLAVKPSRLGSASAVIFCRDSSLPEGVGTAEFEIRSGLVELPAAEERAAAAEAAGAASAEPAPPPTARAVGIAEADDLPRDAEDCVEVAVLPAPAPVYRAQAFRPPSRTFSSAWIAVLLLVAAALGAGAWRLLRTSSGDRAAASAPKSIQLRAVRQYDAIRIEWDRSSAAVKRSTGAFLEVVDGDYRNRIEVGTLLLRTGSVVYQPQSGDVLIRMQLRGAGGETLAEEATRHLRPIEQTAARGPGKPLPELKQDVPVVTPTDQSHRSIPEGPVERIPSPPAVIPKPFLEARARVQPLTEQLPVPPNASVPAPITAPPLQLPQVPVQPFPLVPKNAPPEVAYKGPRSGRLIWTGSLERRGVIELDQGKVNGGSILGSLPGVAVELRAYPAELAEKGLVVYSDDNGLSRTPKAEMPGAGNGWNRTHFVFEPVRARQIAVLEEPNVSNSFRRLVLRSDARNCSVVLIEWRVR